MNELWEKLRSDTPMAKVGAGVFLALALIWFVMRLWPSSGVTGNPQIWLYDLNTKELVAAKAGPLAPRDLPSGDFRGQPAGVDAHVYRRPEDTRGKSPMILWLEKYDPKTKAALENGQTADVATGLLIATPNDLNWIAKGSSEGIRLENKLRRQIADQKLVPLEAP